VFVSRDNFAFKQTLRLVQWGYANVNSVKAMFGLVMAVAVLMGDENIDHNDLIKILGQRVYEPVPEYIDTVI
jgi:hypothetical protein